MAKGFLDFVKDFGSQLDGLKEQHSKKIEVKEGEDLKLLVERYEADRVETNTKLTELFSLAEKVKPEDGKPFSLTDFLFN